MSATQLDANNNTYNPDTVYWGWGAGPANWNRPAQ